MSDPGGSSSSYIPTLAKLASLAVFLSIGYSFVTSSSSSSSSRLQSRKQRRPSSFFATPSTSSSFSSSSSSTTTSSSSPSPNQDLRRSVIVIGGGFAGLAAATRLSANGFSVIILEGLDRIGGRAWTHRVARLERPGTKEDHNFELGAQWLHGTVGHPLFPIAEEQQLLEGRAIHASDFRQRWVRASGKPIDEARVRKVLDWLDEFADEFSVAGHQNLAGMEQAGVRDVGAYFRRRLKEKQAEDLLLRGQKTRSENDHQATEAEGRGEGGEDDEEARERQREYEELDLEVLQWREAFEDTITSADNCAQVSLRHFHEYHTLEGEHTLIPKGYQRIAEILAAQLPRDSVRLNHTVSKIVYHPERDDFPRVVCTNGAEFEADHVVVTLPLGVMKERAVEIFEPALPAAKTFAVSRLGFGVVDKLYFEFPAEYDCHRLGGCGFLWPVNPDTPTWLQKIFTVHMVSTNSMVLWLSGEAARHMENLPEAQLVQDVLQVLRDHFDPSIPAPKNVLRANWHNNEFFRGSYTFVPVGASGNDIDSLAEPICEKGTRVPRVLFAGEATHRYFYSTTHGAFLSGEREAKRIIECED